MKRFVFAAIVLACLSPETDACVGKTLHIGVVESPGGKVLAEMLAGIINERTGTTVAVQLYGTDLELYEAVKAKQIDISIENTAGAMRAMNMPVSNDANRAYETVKASYEKDKGLVWLKPFGFHNANGDSVPAYTSAVLRLETLNNFPALPRVIGKMGSAITDDAYAKLVRSVESGEQPKKVAREFLRSRKLI